MDKHYFISKLKIIHGHIIIVEYNYCNHMVICSNREFFMRIHSSCNNSKANQPYVNDTDIIVTLKCNFYHYAHKLMNTTKIYLENIHFQSYITCELKKWVHCGDNNEIVDRDTFQLRYFDTAFKTVIITMNGNKIAQLCLG